MIFDPRTEMPELRALTAEERSSYLDSAFSVSALDEDEESHGHQRELILLKGDPHGS